MSLMQIKRMEMEARSFSPDRSRVLLTKARLLVAHFMPLMQSMTLQILASIVLSKLYIAHDKQNTGPVSNVP